MAKNNWMISAVIIAALLGAVAFLGYKLYAPTGAAATVEGSGAGTVFTGRITNVQVSPGTISGVGAYDRNCIMQNDGSTECDGGVKTEAYGVLNFHYNHFMDSEPCIAPGDRLQVEILDADGNARITRFGASGHHG